MVKCKTFYRSDPFGMDELENDINNWLGSNQNIEIVSTNSYSILDRYSTTHVTKIFYKEKEN